MEQNDDIDIHKIPACCDDDDDYDSAITPVLSTEEPMNSLSMGDEHLDTIPATKSDEVIKSSVEDLVPIPSESEGENGCDVPSCFSTFSNILFDADYDFDSVHDQSLHNEDVLEKIFSNPLLRKKSCKIHEKYRSFHRIKSKASRKLKPWSGLLRFVFGSIKGKIYSFSIVLIGFVNGNSKKSLGRDSKGGIIILPPVFFEEHVAVQRETKARTLFGGNKESKKMRKTMLKQAFSEFSVSEEEGLHKGFDRALPPSWS
nr:hypothetical protein [Tanacetum cinerariifolium]